MSIEETRYALEPTTFHPDPNRANTTTQNIW